MHRIFIKIICIRCTYRMKKYKMCLFCKTYNPSELFECINCGATLINVEEAIETDTFQNEDNIKNNMENYNDLDKFNI